MLDFIAVTGALTAIKTISDIAKNINSAELTQEIIELQGSILEMQKEMFEMQAETLQLREENQGLRKSLKIQDDAEYEQDVYWKREGNDFSGPFCTVCLDKDRQWVRMTAGVPFPSRNAKQYSCQIHHRGMANLINVESAIITLKKKHRILL
jgi:hypothetical protein